MKPQAENDTRRRLPSVGKLLEHPQVALALERMPRTLIIESLRSELEEHRKTSGNGTGGGTPDNIVTKALERAEQSDRPSLCRAINATGVVLHTGLGRAALSEEARDAIMEIASGHSVVEIDMETGRRGSRQAHVRGLLCELTGAESAFVVNNNAAAVFLCVNALSAGKEVVLSRGELVEIGGSFRMPDIVRSSGATLVEVGTTNRTRLSDFDKAVTDATGLLLRCHPSNFRIVGFTEEVSASDLARLGRERGVPTMDDLGSGAILDTAALGAGPTVTLRAAIESGVDIVTASGDKLLGGPQAGVVLGRKDYVERIAKHPLARALRVDKLTLAALEATLRLYRDPAKARERIPTLRYLSRSSECLAEMAERLRQLIEKCARKRLKVDTVPEQSQVGGGSLPGENLPTTCVRVRPGLGDFTVEDLVRRLREGRPPIFARIKENALLLDPRTLEPEEVHEIAAAIGAICK